MYRAEGELLSFVASHTCIFLLIIQQEIIFVTGKKRLRNNKTYRTGSTAVEIEGK